MSKLPLHIAITHQPKTPSMTKPPSNTPPLWEVMERTSGTVANWDEMIRAVRDWVALQLPEVGAHVIRTLLTAEAERAERGEVEK